RVLTIVLTNCMVKSSPTIRHGITRIIYHQNIKRLLHDRLNNGDDFVNQYILCFDDFLVVSFPRLRSPDSYLNSTKELCMLVHNLFIMLKGYRSDSIPSNLIKK